MFNDFFIGDESKATERSDDEDDGGVTDAGGAQRLAESVASGVASGRLMEAAAMATGMMAEDTTPTLSPTPIAAKSKV